MVVMSFMLLNFEIERKYTKTFASKLKFYYDFSSYLTILINLDGNQEFILDIVKSEKEGLNAKKTIF